jgi:hypothetical protein
MVQLTELSLAQYRKYSISKFENGLSLLQQVRDCHFRLATLNVGLALDHLLRTHLES